MSLMIVFIAIGVLVTLLLIRSKQVLTRRRAREAAWFAAALARRSHGGPEASRPGDARRHFRSKPVLLPPEAAHLYYVLLEAFPKMVIFSQVGVARILYLKDDDDWEEQDEIARLSVDFLICKTSKTGIIPTAAVDLDNPANAGKEQQRLARQKRRAFEEAGLPLLTCAFGKIPDVEALRLNVANAVVARNRAAKKTGT
ncbi:MAG: DUF2726 domain-containing protein [Azoarcus sp.]|jgi:hypothetical protein|nr:DUF2726 domain-containing protein [Azoarcus sp.]